MPVPSGRPGIGCPDDERLRNHPLHAPGTKAEIDPCTEQHQRNKRENPQYGREP